MSTGDPRCPAHGALQPCEECLRLAGQAFAGNPPVVDVQGPERLARCLDNIVKVMRDPSLPHDFALSEIQDYLTIAGYDVPLRSYRESVDAPRATDAHPEAFCERCGRPNVTWFAPSEVWNRAVPEGGILCPVCFVQSAERAGIRPPAWEVRPEIVSVDAPRAEPPTVEDLLALAERMPADVFASVEHGDFSLRMLLRIVAGRLGGWQAGRAARNGGAPDGLRAALEALVENVTEDAQRGWSHSASTEKVLNELRAALGSAPHTELEVAIAPQVSGESWLNEDAWRWLRDLYEYAATQTRAIPTLAKLTPEEFCWALYSALHGKPGLMEVAEGSAPRGTQEDR